MRVREPVREGYVERDGVKVFWEVHGEGPSTIYLVPTFPIVDLQWAKTLIPYLSKHFRVVTNDPRGNGRSDRPSSPDANAALAHATDVVAVMDATGTDTALLVGVSQGVVNALFVHHIAAERISGMVLSGPFIPTVGEFAEEYTAAFEAAYDRPTGDELFSRQGLTDHFDEFCAWWMKERVLTEPHSRSAQRDMIGYCRNASPESILAGEEGFVADAVAAWSEASRVRCPVLVHHGAADVIDVCPVSNAERLAEATGGELVIVEGGGHASLAQDAVFGARLIRDFAERVFPHRPRPSKRTWARAAARPRQALFVATALGLGHVRRDIAVARELRRHHPDLEVRWLAEHPATVVLAEEGEQVHPASRWLANESAHVEEHGHEHDLAVFDAFNRMDEAFVNNFLVFHDAVDEAPVDLVVADEAWGIDHHLHENPELKRFAYAWMSDWVGFLPVPERGPEEAAWTADSNAHLVEHRARYGRVRDLGLFVGQPADVPDASLGRGLPTMRQFADAWYRFPGYITGYGPPADRAELRAELGYGDDELVCVVAAGGTAVGVALLRKAVASLEEARRLVPNLRMLAVCGPRIDPDAVASARPGLDIRGYVPALHRHLHAADLAIVQGGLTTTMECVAAGTPFLYFPLAEHFEQQYLVRHRLDRYGAGRCMDYRTVTPEQLAVAIAAEIGRPTSHQPVETDGAAKAGAMLASLL